MLDRMNEYIFEKNRQDYAARLHRIATEPCWAEHLAVVAWVPVRVALRGIGYTFLAGGDRLLRLTGDRRPGGLSGPLISPALRREMVHQLPND